MGARAPFGRRDHQAAVALVRADVDLPAFEARRQADEDGYLPPRAVANTRELVERDGVFALLSSLSAYVLIGPRVYFAMARDGEGATKFMTVQIEKGRDRAECKQIAYAIARSPLVKTAFFASDPNLGRILAAIGYAGVQDLDVQRLKLFLDNVLVAEHGGRAASYREEDGQRVMQQSDITIRVALDRGTAAATVWTCDFSYDYVKINASYRS